MANLNPAPKPAVINLREILLYNDRFLAVAYLSVGWSVIVLLINVLHLGGDRFVQGLNSVMAVLFTIAGQAFVVRIREKLKNDSRADLLWLALLLSFGLWSLLEVLRMLLLFLSPAPRFAFLNWFWILGYLTALYAFYLHFMLLEGQLTARQRQMLLGVGLFGGLLSAVVLLLPAFLGFPNRYTAGIVFSLLYGLADLGLLLILLRIFFFYGRGYGGPWKFFTLAWAIKFLGVVVLQFPSNHALGAVGWSFWLSIANFAHYYWYGFAVLGLFVYYLVLQHQTAPQQTVARQEYAAPNASALVFTDEQDRVIKTSLNFRFIMRLPEQIATSDLPLQQLLGVNEETYRDLRMQLRKQGSVKKMVFEPVYHPGQKAWITAAAALDQERRYNGMNVVVQVVAEGVAGSGLTNEERALVDNIFLATGSEGEDHQKLLVDYFNMIYKMFSNLVTEYEGSRRAAGLNEIVNQAARKQKMSLQVLEQELNVTGDLKLDDLGKAVSILLAAARSYVTNLAGPEVVRREVDHLHQQLDRSTKTLVSRYKLAG